MPRVLITNKSRVHLPAGPYPPPGDTVQLSFFDAFWIFLPPVQRLFLYPDAALPFASIIDSLKSSLSRTLPVFHPFGGKLTYLPASDEAVIDCTAAAAEGVAFVEAESDLDIRRLAGDAIHDSESFLQLVPDLGALELPAPVLGVQVTAFAGGGVAVGLAVHHVLADGKGLWQFVEAWSTACRVGTAPPVPVPSHDRAAIRHAGGPDIARKFLRQLAPSLPKVRLLLCRFGYTPVKCGGEGLMTIHTCIGTAAVIVGPAESMAHDFICFMMRSQRSEVSLMYGWS